MLCLSPATDLCAQSATGNRSGGAFDSLSFALRVTANVNRNTFHEFWDPAPGLELEASTPFYLGAVEMGAHYTTFTGLTEAQPDFKAVFPYLGWGLGWSFGRRITWHNSARVGISFQTFEGIPGNNTERELGVDVGSRLTVGVLGPWAVDLAGRYQVVFTHERLRWLLISAGARGTFTTPSWLKDFLR